MKSFKLVSKPWSKTLIIASLLFCLMAFQDPSVSAPASPVQNVQVADTVPKSDININIDLSKILADVDVALAKIDFEKIGKEIQISLDKIDFTKMQNDIDASLKSIDWEKMNRDIQKSLKGIDTKKIQIEIQKGINDTKKQMNSKEFKESMQKAKEINMNEMREELRKAKIELEKNKDELKKELLKMKGEAGERDAVLLDNFGFERSFLILI